MKLEQSATLEQNDLKYYVKKDAIDLKEAGFPGTFPIIYRVTSEEIREIKELLVQANLRGLSPDIRSIYFLNIQSYRLKISSIIERLDNLDEVSAEIWEFTEDIVCWNPFEDILNFLSKYIAFSDTHTQDSALKESIDDIIENIAKQVNAEREVALNA